MLHETKKVYLSAYPIRQPRSRVYTMRINYLSSERTRPIIKEIPMNNNILIYPEAHSKTKRKP